MGEVVRYEVDGDIAVVTIDNPPVNALGAGVSEGIVAAVDRAAADPAIRAVVLTGAGRSFIAGADIRRFGTKRETPARRSYDALEASPKPVVAAIHGFALGGGLENALCCTWRIAVPDAKVGLPEVLIGVIPGGGGTQRLPRLAGVKAALDMITSGRHVPARDAAALGIIDGIVETQDLPAAAVAFARSVAGKGLRRVGEIAPPQAEPGLFEAQRKAIARKARGQPAPFSAIAAVEAATRLPFAEGLAEERRLFAELENSAEAQAMRYAFFAERTAAKLSHLPSDMAVPDIRHVAVIGAGTMGGGIAMSLADAGLRVKLLDASPEGLAKGLQKIRDNYAVSVKRGSLRQEDVDHRLSLIEPVDGYDAIVGCDAVIEAIFEQLTAKQDVFRQLDGTMQPGAMLFTNTSALDIDLIAAATKRPEAVAGTHFFAPANVMKLLEVVEGSKTAPATMIAAMRLGRTVGKVSAYAGTCDGFVANRSRIPFGLEQNLMVEEGARPEHIDRVMVEFGYPMGPFAVNDLSGLDVNYMTRKRRAAADPNYRTWPVADRLVEMGRKGQKTGAGWYRYEPGDRTPHPDPVVDRIARELATEFGIEQRSFSDEEVLRRLLFASVNEACKILAEGKALRASDIDVMWLNGFGFPRYRGGLMLWADRIGAREVYNQIAAWHQRYGARWTPAPLLREIANAGGLLREAKAPQLSA
ncbi:3-hydroxyacyl-CoA dehydrogenase NAD-binding domain-containing protein [Belnapia moabensis]|uniref:3-hydroxyacyl-CoA dehydrogenase NAD-binding domain-containing protein n=1 Tax=Belnapia moabensis TaxID=365533 RepID=UPI0005B8C314|nr:3-hydroxyacyl-CoA dehydrogenase NAD-binding domain-containing protein [Belnapia moabensis]